MFRTDVNKYKQKSFDFNSMLQHPPNSLLSLMNRTQKTVRVQTDNTDSKSNTYDSIIIQNKPSTSPNKNIVRNQYFQRGKSKSVLQAGFSQMSDTPDNLYEDMSIHNLKYAPSKFKLSINQLAQEYDIQLIEDFLCFKCKNISDEINECVGCGHLFCYDCIRVSDNTCFDSECCYSFDNQEDKRNLYWDLREPSKIILKKISQLHFKCLNESLGCDQTFDIKSYRKHIENECEYILAECPNRCSEFTLLTQQSQIKHSCLYIGPKKFMLEHLKTCNEKQNISKKKYSNEEVNQHLKQFLIGEFNSGLNASQEEPSSIFEKYQLYQQNSQSTSKVITYGDEQLQSQFDEIIDIKQKIQTQNQMVIKQSEQIDKQQEENRKIKDQIDKFSKDTDQRIQKLQQSSTQIMLEMQQIKKAYNEKLDEIFQMLKEIQDNNSEKIITHSQSGGGLNRYNSPNLNSNLSNQAIGSYSNSNKSEQTKVQNQKYFSSNNHKRQDSGLNIYIQENVKSNQFTDIKNQKPLNTPPKQGQFFTTRLEEIKQQNGEDLKRNNKQFGFFSNEQQKYGLSETQISQFYQQQEPIKNNEQYHQCKQCQQKLIYTPNQFLKFCFGCNKNKSGIYYCQNCQGCFYCIECCPLLLKKGFCPNNHSLVLNMGQNIQYDGTTVHKCNICARTLRDNNQIKQFSCLQCDFDICAGCLNMKLIGS